MAWNPYPSDAAPDFLGMVLGNYKPGQLGAAPTLGNQEAQVDYARQLAEALAQQQQAEAGMGMADRLSQAQYAPNSGALGSLAMVAQAYAGKKIRGKESKAQAEALEKAYGAQSGMASQAEARKLAQGKQAEQEKIAAIRKAIEEGDVATLAALNVDMPERKAPSYVDVPNGRGGTIMMESTPDGLRPIRVAGEQPRNTPAQDEGFKVFRDAIAGIESAGSGDYSAIGPVTKTGDRAIGRYQVMGANIPEWTKAALGRAMTPQEFAASPEAQDAVFDHRFGQYVQKYGPEGAARAWFAGEGGMNKGGAKDSLGTSVDEYAQKFTRGMGGTQEQYSSGASGVIPGGLGYNPPKAKEEYRTLSPEDVAKLGLPRGSVAQMSPTGQVQVISKPDARDGTGGVLPLSAGEAAKVRNEMKDLRDSLGMFRAFDEALQEIPSDLRVLTNGQAKGRLGTAYNNARSSLRTLYNTGVLQPGELPMLEKALRDPTSPTAVADPRTRGELRAQLDELYNTISRNMTTRVESYPQLYNQDVFNAKQEERKAARTG